MTEAEQQAASKSLFEASQHATGISISNAAAWLGPAVASLWIWTSILPLAMPGPALQWLEQIARDAGWSAQWALDTHTWLVERPNMFWALIAIAVFTMSIRQNGISTITWGALLLATSIRPPGEVGIWFLGITLGLCISGWLCDARKAHSSKKSEDPSYADFGSSTGKWIAGPLLTLARPLFLPLLVIAGAVETYRVGSGHQRYYQHEAIDLAAAMRKLRGVPIAKASTEDVMTVLTRAILLPTRDDRWEKDAALYLMHPDQQSPTGAAQIPRQY